MTEEFEVNSYDVTHERLDGEVVAINMTTGRYYSLSGPAADVWWLLDQRVARRRWIETLTTMYPSGDVTAGLDDFVSRAVSAGLVRHCAQPSDSSNVPPQDFARGSWSEPRLEEFEDLQDLILVDPIHDTTALGWPHIADTE